MSEFNEQRYYEAYKILRNRFRKYEPEALIDGCLNYLGCPVKDKLQQLQKQPWLVLLLIKWIIIDEQYGTRGRKIPTERDVHNTLQLIHDMGNKIRMPTQFEHHTLFFRAVAYQQFIYQQNFAISHLARQFILFADLPEDHQFKLIFLELTGIHIQTFLELSLVLLVKFLVEKGDVISPAFFSTLGKKYEQDDVTRFLQSFSRSLPEVRKLLLARNDGTRPAAEYFEQTPFLAFPLIRKESNYHCVEQHVLFRSIEHFIYDRMKLWNAQKFMNEFGLMFERYVEKVIRYSGLPYINENEVKTLIGEKGKVIDFILADGKSNVFIDAKAAEMAYQGKVAHLSETVEEKAQQAIGAITQAHDVIARLDTCKKDHPFISKKDENFLLVITFKDLHLNNGRSLYDGVAKGSIDAIYARYLDTPLIPVENMYFLNIDEFEFFCQAIHTGQTGLVEGLKKARNDDADPKSRKFGFSLHLASWGQKNGVPDFLQKRFDTELDQLMELLK